MSRMTKRGARKAGRRSSEHKGCCARCGREVTKGIPLEHRGKRILIGRECLNQAFGRSGKFSEETMQAQRRSFLPPAVRDLPPFKPEGTDLEIWVWDAHDRFYAIAFHGKAGKPLGHFAFRSDDNRMKWLKEIIESRKYVAGEKTKRLEERRSYQHDFKVGDIFVTSWGYDQTNVNFYEVTEVRGKDLIVRAIASRTVDENKNITHVVPAPGVFTGPPMRVRPQQGDYARIDDHYAKKWDGKPEYATASGWGH